MIERRRSTFGEGTLAWIGILIVAIFPIGNTTVSRAEAADSGTATASPSSKDEVLVVPRTDAGSANGRDVGPGLDDLLRLPTGFDGVGAPRVAGTSETEWRRRFTKSTLELEEAKTELEQTKHELDGVAEGGGASQWSVAPPGGTGGENGGQSTSPLSFKLRQQLKRNRERIETAERALRELRIEADLAGVPPNWRVPKAEGTGSPGR